MFAAGTVAYSYTRISSTKQVQGEGVERQTALSEDYAKKHGLILDEALEDIGRSGWSGANLINGALGRFLEMVANGQVERGSILLVESLDRLSRQHPIDAQVIMTSLLNAGITIVTIQDGNIYSSKGLREDWTKLIGIIAIQARAHEESERKSQLSKSAAEKRRQNAIQGNGRYSANIPAWLNQFKDRNGDTHYELNDQADTIRLIFELAKDGCGQMAITKELNRLGKPSYTSRSKGWHQSNVGRILDNHAAYGTLIPYKTTGGVREQYGDPIPDYFPALISEDDFHAAQRHRMRHIVKGRKGNRFTNLFNGMAFCDSCGGKMVITYGGNAKKGSRPYMRCYNAARKSGCDVNPRYFIYDDLEVAVLDTVRELGISDYLNFERHNPDRKTAEEAIRKVQAELAEIDRKEQNLIEQMMMLSKDSAAVVHKALDRLQGDKREAQGRLKDAERQKALLIGADTDFNDVDTIIQQERRTWPNMSDIEVYRSRSRVNTALRYIYPFFFFNSETGLARLAFGNGLFSYIYKDGKLDSIIDLIETGHVGQSPGQMKLQHFASHISATDPASERSLSETTDALYSYIVARNKRIAMQHE